MRLIIVASGPFKTPEDLARAESSLIPIMTVNDMYRFVLPAYAFAADYDWWARHHDKIPKRTKRWTTCWTSAQAFGLQYVHLRTTQDMKAQRGEVCHTSLCRIQGVVHSGYNSGFQAINLAYHLGYKKVGLIGYDGRSKEGQVHCHGRHEGGLNNPDPWLTPGKDGRTPWEKIFHSLAQSVDATPDFEVVNLSPTSPLAAFRRSTWADFRQ